MNSAGAWLRRAGPPESWWRRFAGAPIGHDACGRRLLGDRVRLVRMTRLNALQQFTTEIDGVEIHFIHVRSQHENALPLIMSHGWPGSVIELLETVGPLTDPTAHGGKAEDAFHLVLPSLPATGSRANRPCSAGTRPAPHARGRS